MNESVSTGRRELRRSAVLLVAALAAFMAAWSAARPHREIVATVASSVGASRDIDMYAAIVQRLRAGESYHHVVGSELRTRNYPTIPVFNWRTPLLYSMMSRVPPAVARGVLLALAAAMLAATGFVLFNRPAPIVIAGLLIQLGAVVAVSVPAAPLMSEAWTGILIGLSVCAYSRGHDRSGAVLGLVALFVRELAAPYVVLCATLAFVKRRSAEMVIWATGFILYIGYFGWHFSKVSALLQPGDFAHPDSWFYAGGLEFLTSTLRMNAFALAGPVWSPALLAALIAAGVVWGKTPIHIRSAGLLYVVLFLAIGQPFNYYWGLVTAPLWALAAGFGVDGTRNAVMTLKAQTELG